MKDGITTLIVLSLMNFNAMVSRADEKTMVINADEQYRYAKSLYDRKDYFTAVVEFNRFIHFFPGDPRMIEAQFNIGLAWYNGGKPAEALKVFERIMDRPDSSLERTESFFMAAKCHEKSGNPVLGEVVLKNLIMSTDDPAVKDKTENAIGWLRMNSGKWDDARKSFESISEIGKPVYSIPEILAKLDKIPDIPHKSPIIAGSLAIFPGGGFLYCGRPKDALTAFLVNGGLIAAAVQSFRKKEYALGSVISFVEFGFYSGNIYGSVSAAHKYNRLSDRNFIESIKQSLKPGLFSQNGHGVGLSISCDY